MEAQARRPRPLALVALLVMLGALACAGFVALGVWQVQRLAWKEALVERIERHVQAPPVPAPGPADWAGIGREDEYRRLQLAGRFDYGREVLVRASTVLGSGYWVLTPLRTESGPWVLVNRGFVPPQLRTRVPRGDEVQVVIGLLRLPEPGGSVLQDNDPAAGRWYSRDVAAIAAAQGLQGPVAPFFVDVQAPAGARLRARPGLPGEGQAIAEDQPVAAGSSAAREAWPRPGLTVLTFTNNHLVYALTWFALAAIMAGATGFLLWHERRQRREDASHRADPQP